MIPNNVAFLAEMLEVLVLALSVMEEEATAFGLHINWSKTKIVQFCNPATCSTVQVADGQVGRLLRLSREHDRIHWWQHRRSRSCVG